MTIIGNNTMVSIRFNMYDNAGDLLEERMNADPIIYLQGGSAILGLLQEQLKGMMAGDSKRVELPAIDGLAGDGYYFDVVIDNVRQALAEEILLGYALTVATDDCGSDCKCYENTSDKWVSGQRQNHGHSSGLPGI